MKIQSLKTKFDKKKAFKDVVFKQINQSEAK